MSHLSRRLTVGLLLLAVSAVASGAPFVMPLDKNPPFRRDRLPIDSEAMISLSKQLTLLTQGVKLKTAEDRRSAAQALAVAVALDPANNGARESLSTLADGGELDRPKQESFDAAKARISEILAWLLMPEAGTDGNTLAALIGDPVAVLDRDSPDAARNGGSGKKDAWKGWVAPLSAFEEQELAKNDTPDEIEQDKPPEKPDSKAEVVLEKAELKTVLHTYDTESNTWSFGLSSVKMEASPKSPDVEIDPEDPEQGMKRKELEVLVPTYSSSDYWRIERNVVDPIEEALSEIRSDLPDEGQIKLLVGGGNYSFQKNHSYLTGPGFILANSALTGVEPGGTVLGELDKNNRMSVPPFFWRQISALSKQKAGRVIVPAGTEEYLINLLILAEPEFFLNNEILIASSNEEFVELSKREPSPERAAVFAKFDAIAAKAEGNPIGTYLTNRFVRQRLEEIATEAPYHLSAKLLSTNRPQFLSRKALAAEIWRVIDPLNELTSVDLETDNTAKFEGLYETMRESFENLRRYAELRDRELVDEGEELASKVRTYVRARRGRGELWEKYSEVFSARREIISQNDELKELLSEASGDPLPEDLERKRRKPKRKRDR